MTWGTGTPEHSRGWWDQNPQQQPVPQQYYSQQPQPGWGPPPPAPPPPGNNNRTPILIAVAALVVVALGVGGYFAFGRSSGTTQAAAPTQTSSSVAATIVAPSTADPAVATGSATATDPTALYGIWNGTYMCGQGATALTLTLAPATTESGFQAVFSFGSTPGNAVPTGSFLMSGSLINGVLQLNPLRWVHQPPGYGMVALSAEVTGAKPGALVGQVQSPACTTFSVTRQ